MTPRSLPATIERPAQGHSQPAAREPIGVVLGLVFLWLWFEYGRPANPLFIPMLISVVSLGTFLLRPDKRWNVQSWLFVVLLALFCFEIPIAVNGYSAFWTTYGMAATIVCICLPLPSLLTSPRKIGAFAGAFVLVMLYVGGYALFNHGYGPGGVAGQDENYVASMMGMAIPFAYFSIFVVKRTLAKVALATAIAVFCGATVVAGDVSRGGFLGLCSVFLYCVFRSPRKWLGFVVIGLIIVAVFGMASHEYWEDLATMKKTDEGTADMRLEIWSIGVRAWKANPIFGVGPGSFRWVVGEYQSAEQVEKFGRSLGGVYMHSLWVELLAELGLAGLTITLLLLATTWRSLRRVQRGAPHRPGTPEAVRQAHLRCYADAVAASILACVVNGVFLSLFYYSFLWILIAAGSAVAQVHLADVAAAGLRPAAEPMATR